jgi:autotransporter-associated beta strand protein
MANGSVGAGNGGLIHFAADSTGGASRLEIFGNGSLDISGHNPPAVFVGSNEGDGTIFLDGNRLIVGTNNLTTSFSGIIQDGGENSGVGGSLTKRGPKTLTLSGRNTYTGGTTVSGGTLLITARRGSGTGSGKVSVNAGTLGGNGTISGAVTVGTGRGTVAFLSPGVTGPGTLTLKKNLTFKGDGTYNFELKSSNATADGVVAKGVSINAGAPFSLIGLGGAVLTQGTVFTVISNTSATPIAGTYGNLPDGAIVTVNGNNLQASYHGGDGNDLTLTVVP